MVRANPPDEVTLARSPPDMVEPDIDAMVGTAPKPRHRLEGSPRPYVVA
jgi:hypothetical protein